MSIYKYIVSSLLILNLSIGMVSSSFGQCSKPIETVYGKIVSMDTAQKLISGKDFLDHGNKVYYGIYHLRVQTYLSDTVTLAVVYHLRNEREMLQRSFNFFKDSAYIFSVAEFTPCQSDFPYIRGCESDTKKSECLYRPQKGQIISTPYKSSRRIIESSVLYVELWEELLKKYKNQ